MSFLFEQCAQEKICQASRRGWQVLCYYLVIVIHLFVIIRNEKRQSMANNQRKTHK